MKSLRQFALFRGKNTFKFDPHAGLELNLGLIPSKRNIQGVLVSRTVRKGMLCIIDKTGRYFNFNFWNSETWLVISKVPGFLYINVFSKAISVFLNLQYATDGSNFLLITGPNMVSKRVKATGRLAFPSYLLSAEMFCLFIEWKIHILETNSVASDNGAGWMLCASGVRFIQSRRSDSFKDRKRR